MSADQVRSRIGEAPDAPGVYRFVDANGDTLYVGKAKHLARRLGSYLRGSQHPRTARMLSLAVEVTWTLCASEAEALVLEHSWIRSHRPRFNVLMVEGGDYPSVYLHTPTDADGITRVRVGRGPARRGEERHGPYPGVRARDLGDALVRAVPVRSCDDSTFQRAKRSSRPCLLAEMGRCAAPCVGRVDADAHRALVAELRDGLRSGGRTLIETLERRMADAAGRRRYEEAASLRDTVTALRAVLQQRGGTIPADACARAVAVRTRGDGRGVCVVVSVEHGAVTGIRQLAVSDGGEDRDEQHQQLLYAALCEDGMFPLLLLEEGPADRGTLADALAARLGTRPSVVVPRRGWRHDVVALAARNADDAVARVALRRPDSVETRDEAMRTLADIAGWDGPVSRIECLDISHTQGQLPVGSFSVALNGEVAENEGRVVHLPAEIGGDDYASIREALRRRFSGRKLGMGALPQVLVIDGGRGQVGAAHDVMDDLFAGVLDGRPQLVGLAKAHEELWLPLTDAPVMLPRTHPAQLLAQAVRDQAHRQGVTHHRRRRERAALSHGLEELPGVGDVLARRLLERFGSVQAVAGAAVADLTQIDGIGEHLARRIHRHFHP